MCSAPSFTSVSRVDAMWQITFLEGKRNKEFSVYHGHMVGGGPQSGDPHSGDRSPFQMLHSI
jgi:hypothetical protein